MDRRLLILFATGILIFGLTAWRLNRTDRVIPSQQTLQSTTANSLAVPPTFELPDQRGNFVKFDRYRTRQGVVVVFFAADEPAHQDTTLNWLREHYPAIKKAGYEVLGISAQTGATIRRDAEQAGIDWPFPILHDIHFRDPVPAPVHHLWGRFVLSPNTQLPDPLLPGTFVVDQSGLTPHKDGVPLPLADPVPDLEQLLN